MIRFVALLLALVLTGQSQAAYIDAINPGAVPSYDTAFGGSYNNIGWYYTPSQNYLLTALGTEFAQDEFGGGTRTVTFQILTDRPVNGGMVLAQGSTSINGFVGATPAGTTFATPIALAAGVTYFVDILNVSGLNVNLGQWGTVNGQHVATEGATTRLSAWYFGSGTDTSFVSSQVGNAADGAAEFGPVSGLEPILLFTGTALPSVVPEPASFLMVGVGMIGLAWRLCRR